MASRIEILDDELITQHVEAIVSVANKELQPQTHEQAALFAMAGPKLAQECAHVSPCPPGEARITRGYGLTANFIIHTVPPLWGGGENGEDKMLTSCYTAIFELVDSFEITSLALPPLAPIETGYPAPRAAQIAMQAVISYLKRAPQFKALKLVCPDEASIKLYEKAFDAIAK